MGGKPRSGLQQLLLRLLSTTSLSPSKPTLSRRELRRQQRQTDSMPTPMSGDRSRSKPFPKPQTVSGHPDARHPESRHPEIDRERVIPLNTVRSEVSPNDRTRRLPHAGGQGTPHSRSQAASTLKAPPERGTPRPKGVKSVSAVDRNQPRKSAASPQQRSLPIAAFIQGVRLVILGVGVWAIAGTALSMWSPGSRPQQTSQAAVDTTHLDAAQQQLGATGAASLVAHRIEPRQELNDLAVRVAPLTQGLTDMIPGMYVLDLDNGDYFSLNGEASFSAASMIKVPILIAFFQEVDAGNLKLDETLTLQQSDLASGSGEMQYAGVGAQYSALATATNMIIISDNTATNMLIRRLGGLEVLNQRFQQWGLQQTAIHNVLPDLEGTNTTSPKELSDLLSRVSQGDLISMKSRDRMLEIMRRTVNNSLLPASLGEGATISHKTGDIGSAVGDTGLVDLPNGKRYAITAIVKRPHNDDRAYDVIVRLGGAVYDYLNHAGAPATPPAAEAAPATPNPAVPSPAPQQVAPPAEATIPSTPMPNSR